MTRSADPIRRGVALLIVLATLVLVATASVSLLRTAVTARAGWTFAHNAVMAGDLLNAAEAPILHWLSSDSSDVVLALGIDAPRIDVLHDAWQIDGIVHELRICAWDQYGMVPAPVARSGSPLRACLPPEVRRILDQTTLQDNEPSGLDLFVVKWSSDGLLTVFPEAAASLPAWFGAKSDGQGSHGSLESEASVPLAIGAYVATHNQNSINVNTAPRDLVEIALRAAGRGGSDALLAARAEGRSASVRSLPAIGQPDGRAPRIVGASNAWALRIDVRVGALRRSWWSVYEKQRSNRWECVQRLAIPE